MKIVAKSFEWNDIIPYKTEILKGKNYHLKRLKVLINKDSQSITVVWLNLFQRFIAIFTNKYLKKDCGDVHVLSTSVAIKKINEAVLKAKAPSEEEKI
ncbi:hypothetical protein [Parachlamydia sp. AcF125]|uniref:hypothetical protein n=1 Tax=Parachlamydia sp. AcF125 TaxID=2795736 RepID=UPI001BC8FFAB|nr:hypothetical protein [Parachlamydia sp. AcF125]MBS4169276.1 hypothetical protein [Parachlamydia sp. AcF125]